MRQLGSAFAVKEQRRVMGKLKQQRPRDELSLQLPRLLEHGCGLAHSKPASLLLAYCSKGWARKRRAGKQRAGRPSTAQRFSGTLPKVTLCCWF